MDNIQLKFYDTLADTMTSLRVLVQISRTLKEQGMIAKDSKITNNLQNALRELENIYFS